MKKIRIGITDCNRYTDYEKWMKNEEGVEVIRLGYMENNLQEVENCDDIVLPGEEDIQPALYKKQEYLNYCNLQNMDKKRDEFEWKPLQNSQEKKPPVLGTCRG